MANFSDKTVVVTGAGSGIGRAIALGFCSDGASVVGIGRTREDLEETSRLANSKKMHFVVGDVCRPDDVKRLFSEASHRYAKVDILVNNAAAYPKVAFLQSSHAEWSRVIETNVIGLALCCREALPGMMERGFGRIINLGSFAWKGPIPNSSAYSASKAAVHVLTKALSTEIDRHKYPDVLINELMPGIIRTRMSDVGDEPDAVYPHVRLLASLPRNSFTGESFVKGVRHVENNGLRARLKRLLANALRAS